MRSTPKPLRHHRILQLVGREPLLTQEEIVRRLAREGMRITQATLSRDIRELGLTKSAEGYSIPAPAGDGPAHVHPLARMLREFVIEVREAQNLLVVKTTPGSAQPVAAALDGESWPELLGTLGGDDTILAVSPDRKSCQALGKRIRELMA